MAGEREPQVLLVEDTPSLARLYREYLRNEPCEVIHVETGAAALDFLQKSVPEAILLDLYLPDMDGLDILRRVTADQLPSAVVVITAHGSIQTAVEAMRAGAFDFIVKPFTADRLTVTLRNALERQRLTRIVETFKEDFGRDAYCGFIGSALAMQSVYRIIDGAAPSKATVFITGESGTGKEVCAEALHSKSPRADKPFLALNCAAIPRELMESEIFGHVKGAFTGAVSDRDGAATRADGGTLFLDEICEMEHDLQTKLLRFVQTGSFTKVGGGRTEKVDVRFVCATNRDPLKEVESGKFREDLYYRLHVIPIHLPPLREREDDVLLIATHFLRKFAHEEGKTFRDFDTDARVIVGNYEWPGNVRQLQNVIRNIVVLNDGEEVARSMLPAPLDKVTSAPGDARAAVGPGAAPPASEDISGKPPAELIRPLADVERDTIERAIAVCEGNIPQAAAHLGISASTIYRKRLGWERSEAEPAPSAVGAG